MTSSADRDRRLARERLIADREQARAVRRRRGIALRMPSSLPIPRSQLT
jgi:hypothetical protein